MPKLHHVPICLDNFVGVTGPQQNQPRNGAQRREVFDRLVSRAVFSVAHGVMSENENRGQFHDRREPNGGSRVIAEDEKCRPKSSELGKRKAIYDCSHGMLPDTEVQILTGW